MADNPQTVPIGEVGHRGAAEIGPEDSDRPASPVIRRDGTPAESEPLDDAYNDVDSRGRTELATRAVRRLAAHAATEIEGVVPGAKAEATIDGDSVALTVRLTLVYPAPIRKRVREVRAHLLSRVTELCGLTVTRLDINVSLTKATNRPGRVR